RQRAMLFNWLDSLSSDAWCVVRTSGSLWRVERIRETQSTSYRFILIYVCHSWVLASKNVLVIFMLHFHLTSLELAAAQQCLRSSYPSVRRMGEKKDATSRRSSS